MMDPAKVAGVSEWPTLTTKKEVQSFLGFVNFDRRFIEGFSHIARPIFNLTKNNSNFWWSSDEQSTFNSLKENVTSAPILALLTIQNPFVLKWIVGTSWPEQSYLNKAPTMTNGIQ